MQIFNISLSIIFFNFFLLLTLHPLSKAIRLIDLPDKRKTHKINAKLIGGLILVANFFFLYLYFDLNKNLNTLLIYSVFICLIGLIDDKYTLKPTLKLILLFFPIILMFHEGFFLVDLGNYNIIGQVKLGSLSFIFTILSAIILINATNYIDGKDGLLITMFFLINLKLLYLINNSEDNSKYIFVYINLTLLILLFFNLTNIKTLKIFLGDSGSLTIGFFISFILIYFAKNNLVHPILLASTITVIIFDFLCVSLERFLKKKGNIFKADNCHIHHLIYKKTKSNLKTLVIINLINTLFFLINLNIYKIYDLLALFFFILEFFIFFIVRKILIK
jgi:UDP-GlcNAc:undecaprenyl-phosphate GlcNAc-1-phosphate transferase